MARFCPQTDSNSNGSSVFDFPNLALPSISLPYAWYGWVKSTDLADGPSGRTPRLPTANRTQVADTTSRGPLLTQVFWRPPPVAPSPPLASPLGRAVRLGKDARLCKKKGGDQAKRRRGAAVNVCQRRPRLPRLHHDRVALGSGAPVLQPSHPQDT